MNADDDWSFSVEEVSAGVYRVRGVDPAGRTVEATGSDPGQQLEEAIEQALGRRYSASSGWQGHARNTVEIDDEPDESAE